MKQSRRTQLLGTKAASEQFSTVESQSTFVYKPVDSNINSATAPSSGRRVQAKDEHLFISYQNQLLCNGGPLSKIPH